MLVVVGGLWRLVDRRSVGHKILPRNGRNRRLHGIQQTVKLSFTHRTLPYLRERTISEVFWFRLELIDQIVIDPPIAPVLVTEVFIPREP